MKQIPEKLYKKITKVIPIVVVDLIIKDKNGVLLIKRTIPPCIGKWSLVGGKILYKEKIKDAIERHAKTETGLDVKIKRFVGVYDDLRDYTKYAISLCYLVAPASRKIKLGPEGSDIKYFKKLPKTKDICYCHRKMLMDAKIK